MNLFMFNVTGSEGASLRCCLLNRVPLILEIHTSNPLSANIIARDCLGGFAIHTIPSCIFFPFTLIKQCRIMLCDKNEGIDDITIFVHSNCLVFLRENKDEGVDEMLFFPFQNWNVILFKLNIINYENLKLISCSMLSVYITCH